MNQLTEKERPILFKDEMVRALLEGRKSQTRRVIKPKHGGEITGPVNPLLAVEDLGAGEFDLISCPYGRPADRMWVREAFCASEFMECSYRADGSDRPPCGWTPSIHMWRWASRITLEITDVRVEHLREITEQDAIAKGVDHEMVRSAALELDNLPDSPWVGGFKWLWQSVNGPDSWDANPWVWVIEFRRVTP